MWWDSPSSQSGHHLSPRSRTAAAAAADSSPSGSTATKYSSTDANGLSLKRHYLVGVTMFSRESWLSITASSIDELCERVEKELFTRGSLTYLDILYLLCAADSDGGSGGGGSSGSTSPRTFAICPARRRQEAEQVLFRKGRSGRVALITDNSDPGSIAQSSAGKVGDGHRIDPSPSPSSSLVPSSSSYSSPRNAAVLNLIPTKFSCVVRCVPRSIHLTVLCVLSPLLRTELGPIGEDNGVDDVVLHLPSHPDEIEHLLLSRPTEVFRVRMTVHDVTSLSDVGVNIFSQLAQSLTVKGHDPHGSSQAMSDRLRQIVTSAMKLFFFNPRDGGGGGGGGGSHSTTMHSDATKRFKPLTHVGQLSGLVNILCDLSTAHNEITLCVNGAPSQPPPSSQRNVSDTSSPLRSKLLEIARAKPQDNLGKPPTANNSILSVHSSPARSVLATIRSRGGVVPTSNTRNNNNNNMDESSFVSNHVTFRDKASHHSPPRPVLGRSPAADAAAASPPHSDVYYHSEHLRRLGISPRAINDYLVPSKREEEVDASEGHWGSEDPLASAWRSTLDNGMRGVESSSSHQRASGSIVGDALRESATRFSSVDQRRQGTWGPQAAQPISAAHLQTPVKGSAQHDSGHGRLVASTHDTSPRHIALDANGHVVARREAPSDAEEKRMLIQVALHMLLSHPRRNAFPTSTLVTMIPNIVQTFRDGYASSGIPLRFPLSQGDTRDLEHVVNESIVYEVATNPNIPFLIAAENKKAHTESLSPMMHSLAKRTGGGGASSPNFAELDHLDLLAEHHSADHRMLPDNPPMVDRVPVAPPAADHILVLAKPFFDAKTKRLLVFATVGIDIFDGPSAGLHQSSRPYYPAAQQNGSRGAATAATMATIPFRWFLRTAKTNFTDAPSRELPIETFFALGIATTHILSYTVPITVSLEIDLDPNHDWSYIPDGQERVLVHRWRAGGVANVLAEGQEYVVGIEIHRRDVPRELSALNGGTQGEFVQATQAFVIPVGSGAAPISRAKMYEMIGA